MSEPAQCARKPSRATLATSNGSRLRATPRRIRVSNRPHDW
ncbi:MAG: hypothetical protein ACI9I4_000880 [Neolewinella sp.]|jgi:hypothetical protein